MIHPKVRSVGLVAVVFAILLGLQAAFGKLPDHDWAVALEAGLGPVVSFGAGYMTPGPGSGTV